MLFAKRMPKTRPKSGKAQPPSRSRTESTIYAVGDIHGRLDLFEQLIDLIRKDAQSLGLETRPILIILGDLVDRGPESAACIDRATALQSEDWCDVHFIMGNHEEAILLFLKDHEVGPNWAQYGGGATLLSYGVNAAEVGAARGWIGVQEAFARQLPSKHKDFIQNMKLWIELDDYLFVHAGVRPGLPIERQSQTDLLWIRQDFLAAEIPYEGKVVVHGHTPTREAQLKRWRIGVDTGAYASGVLTAVRLKGYERTLIQTLRPE
jgi:serine/threonine protein phosphatase 1